MTRHTEVEEYIILNVLTGEYLCGIPGVVYVMPTHNAAIQVIWQCAAYYKLPIDAFEPVKRTVLLRRRDKSVY